MAVLVSHLPTMDEGFSSPVPSTTSVVLCFDDNISDWNEIESQSRLNFHFLSGQLSIFCTVTDSMFN